MTKWRKAIKDEHESVQTATTTVRFYTNSTLCGNTVSIHMYIKIILFFNFPLDVNIQSIVEPNSNCLFVCTDLANKADSDNRAHHL